jgi:hypothetical protein
MLQKSLAHLRFFKLFGRLGCLSIPFLGFFAISRLPIYFCIDMCPHHNNSEAISTLRIVNMNQIDYFLNSSVFAHSFEDLNTGVKSETKYYSYKILQATPQTTYAYALAKDKKLYTYISAVFVTKDFQNQEITTAVVCGLDKHNFSKSALPLLENEQALCSKKGSWQLGERSTSWKYQLELLRSGFFGE